MRQEILKEKWELEANVIINVEEWEESNLTSHKITNSPMWRGFDWKVKVRYFSTPKIVSEFIKGTSPLCWRGCGMVGDHTHIFWDCPKLQKFWENIKNEITVILNVLLPLNLLYYVVGCIPTGLLYGDNLYILRVLLLIARKMITVSWRRNQHPTVEQWAGRLRQVYIMEELTAQLQMKKDIFVRKWTPVTRYLAK